jgi:hypothetical protein
VVKVVMMRKGRGHEHRGILGVSEEPDKASFDSYTTPRLPALGWQAVPVILESLSIVMTYAFSQKVLATYYKEKVRGRSKALERAFFELPELRATRAVIELAVMFRALDDAQDIASCIKGDFGQLYDRDGKTVPLPIREVMNKIIHAESIQWVFNDPNNPLMVCNAPPEQVERFKWTKAEVPLKMFAFAFGRFAV